MSAIAENDLGAVVSGPVVLPEFGNHSYVFIQDPEGNLLELFELKAKASE